MPPKREHSKEKCQRPRSVKQGRGKAIKLEDTIVGDDGPEYALNDRIRRRFTGA